MGTASYRAARAAQTACVDAERALLRGDCGPKGAHPPACSPRPREAARVPHARCAQKAELMLQRGVRPPCWCAAGCKHIGPGAAVHDPFSQARTRWGWRCSRERGTDCPCLGDAANREVRPLRLQVERGTREGLSGVSFPARALLLQRRRERSFCHRARHKEQRLGTAVTPSWAPRRRAIVMWLLP